ncbi:pitrilysin family protein [Pedobacter sp. MC2016-24]|uniref:M16 family metallopeptidase n=1 Tax=Pedobacter sp. MC2016-24 TaxID=2780090 RepID=UPI0018815E4E|nr:M16 family metallopeptidase [Pedobacter sp. MC2016-24]MBE9600471.1 insulinase family protein [Pedobacter sp. MC2016-24]
MPIKYKFLGLLSIVTLCLTLACKTQLDTQALPLDPELRMGKLPNGFTYYIRKNKTPEKRVTLYLAVKAGSIVETDQQRGVAHFVEHMSFNGTKHFPKKELSNYLEKAGVRFGADINATTTFDETVYQLPLPSDNPKLLAGGLQIMRDWAQEASIEAEDVEKERHVILEEKRVRQGLAQRYDEKAVPLYTNKSHYGARLPIGTEEVVLKVTPEEIRSFYKDWYRPNLQALLVVGDIDVDQMEKDIKAKFSDLKNPEKEKVRPSYHAILTGKNQYMQFLDPELGGISIDILIKQPGDTVSSAADYRTDLVKKLFKQMLSARFRQMSFAGLNSMSGGLNSFFVSVTTKPAETEPALKSVWLELRKIEEQGFGQAELDRIKKSYALTMSKALEEKDKTSSDVLIKSYLQHFLTGSAAPGIAKEYELTQQLLPEISLKEMNAQMKFYLKDTDRDIIVKASPANQAFLPTEASIQRWLEDVYAQNLPPFVDDALDLPLLKTEPRTGKIGSMETIKPGDLQKIMLSNGVKVILKKTNFQNNQILFKGFAEGGASLVSDVDYQSAINAAAIITAAGAGNYDALQLGKLLAGKEVQVSPFIVDNYQGFSGSTTKEDLPAALELLYAYFTEPRKSEESYQTLIGRTREELANKTNDPSRIFADTVSQVLSNHHLRRKPLSSNSIASINLEKAYKVYQDRFADASDFTFLFVGNLDEASIKPLLEKYLGGLPAHGRREKARDLGINIPAGRIVKTVYSGTTQKSSVMLVYSGDFNYNLENTIKMNAVADALNIRMNQRLREQEGGTYTPNVQLSLSKYLKERFSLTISFDCDPKNVDKLIAAAQDEVNKMRTAGPSAENLQKFKAARKLSLQTGATNNGFWLDYLLSQEMNKASLTEFFDYDAALNKITAKSVQEAAMRFIQDKNYIRLVLMPVEK